VKKSEKCHLITYKNLLILKYQFLEMKIHSLRILLF